MTAREFNFDGLIGPTHNYSGLSHGNVASATHRNQTSNPRAAAMQGLQKMKLLADRGVGQCVLPPLLRPQFEFLRQLGFVGTEAQLIDQAFRADPMLLACCYSASNMWTANAATVSPSADCRDGRLHLTPANLSSTLHRSIEATSTERNLRSIFSDPNHFWVHPPLPSQAGLADEGAANHLRFCHGHAAQGIEVFVYGIDPLGDMTLGPKRFPARQTKLASESIARRHGLDAQNVFFLQQTPDAIDAGVFHNDVIAVSNENVLLCHEVAFVDQQAQINEIKTRFEQNFEVPFYLIEFSTQEINLSDVVKSYLFNSQLVSKPDGNMMLICPVECEENAAAKRCTERIIEQDNPIDEVVFFDLRQSMNNGGGPACLRLRVVLTDRQQSAMHSGVILDDQLYQKLNDWIVEHYREQISPDDLRDPQLPLESKLAIESLAKILDLPESSLRG